MNEFRDEQEETRTSFAPGDWPESLIEELRIVEPMEPNQAEGPRFEDLGPIAEGGMAVVHLAFDRTFLREVACKELKDLGDDSLQVQARHKFVEEAQIVGQLDHPNITPVHDLGLDEDGHPCSLTMKLVRGKTLDELVKKHGDRPWDGPTLRPFLDAFLKVCDALAFAHSRGVMHRDLKPSNVMVGSFGQVYLMDWGIALVRNAARDGNENGVIVPAECRPEPEGSVLGTPAYMAPEQAEGWISAIDERTDVYGLGAMLYKVLCGQPPHLGRDHEERLVAACGGEVVPMEEVAPEREIPPGLCRVVEKALSPDPSDRYQSVAELRGEIDSFLARGGWFRVRRFAAGEVIVREGEVGDMAYVIEHGVVSVERSVDGENVTVAELSAGNVFGETSIMAREPRTATVVAKTDVALLEVTEGALNRELGRAPWLRAFVEAVARRFVACNAELHPADGGGQPS